MKTIFIALLVLLTGFAGQAQITGASLQAGGLTCSMCSKAVKTALEAVPFVQKVQVDIKNQHYNLAFKENAAVDLDALGTAVEEAGFSVASLKVTAQVQNLQVEKDEHVRIGSQQFHFLNAKGQHLNGQATFTLVDQLFAPAKEYKKWSKLSKLECVQTGRAAACCESSKAAAKERIYHAVI